MLCVIYGVAERTLRDNVESLICDGEVDCGKSQTTVVIKDSMGRRLSDKKKAIRTPHPNRQWIQLLRIP